MVELKTSDEFEQYYNNQHKLFPDEHDPRDYIFTAPEPKEFPKKVDLRVYTPQIENQGHLNSCTANAGVNALEILLYEANKFKDLSRLFLYWIVREPYSNLRRRDSGAYLRDVFKQASKYGICWENIWPYVESKVNTKPSEKAFKDAKEKLVKEYKRIVGYSTRETERDEYALTLTKIAIANGFPVIIGLRIGKQFFKIHGPLEKQDYHSINSKDNKYVGGHALCIVGYDDDLGGFIVENSWGKHWGDNGFFLLKYEVAMHDIMDAWVCTKFWDISFEPKWILENPFRNYDTIHMKINYYTDLDDQHRLKLTSTVEGGVKPLKYKWKMQKGILMYADDIEPVDDGKSAYVKIGPYSGKEYEWIYTVDIYDSANPQHKVRQYFKIIVDSTKPKPEPKPTPKPKPKHKKHKSKSIIDKIFEFIEKIFSAIFH